jgi:hypothetical protein
LTYIESSKVQVLAKHLKDRRSNTYIMLPMGVQARNRGNCDSLWHIMIAVKCGSWKNTSKIEGCMHV